MSPQAVGNFVHDLVEMAKAFDELPIVKAELEQTKLAAGHLSDDVQSREETILKLKSEIEALHSKVREAEAGRDQAETMFLELDEKAHKVLRALASIQTEAADMERELNPPKPEPVNPDWATPPQPSVASPSPQGPSEANPPQAHPTAEPSPTQPDAGSPPAQPSAATSTGGAGEGVSVGPDPTHTNTSGDGISQAPSESVSYAEPNSNPGVSVSPFPTTAPLDQTGTGTEREASGSDHVADTKHDYDPEPIARWSTEWYDWRARQMKRQA